MRTGNKIMLFAGIGFCLLAACRKEKNTSPKLVNAGRATITLQVKHHTWGVAGCKVYLKDFVTTFPGEDVSLYDAVQVCDPNGFAQFKNVVSGNHYFYAIGYDIAAADTVIGYIPFSFSAVPGESKELEATIYVSEKYNPH